MHGTEECCGFGGTFCVKYPEISTKMVDDKIAHIEASGAGTVLGGDLGCLLNIAGRIKRRGLAGARDAHRRAAGRHGRAAVDRRAGEAADASPQHPPSRSASRSRSTTSGCRPRSTMPAAASCKKRAALVAALPEFEALRERARSVKEHVLANLDGYLERYEAAGQRHGGHVHWASSAEEAREIILEICRKANARTITKGKSMVSEEIGLNDALEAAGYEVDRDRPRRIHHPARQGAAQPHHRAGGAQDARAGGRPVRRAPPPARLHQAPDRSRRDGQRGAPGAARALLQGRCRHHRRQLPDRRNRLEHHRHQRRQRRPDADAGARAHRHQRHRARGADARRRAAPSCACSRAAPPARRPRPTPP